MSADTPARRKALRHAAGTLAVVLGCIAVVGAAAHAERVLAHHDIVNQERLHQGAGRL